MALSPRMKERLDLNKQLGCFPRSEDKLRSAPGTSAKSSKGALDEKELMEVRNYWQEEYKSKVSELANLEAVLKDTVKSRNIEVEKMRMSYENELDSRNSEILELRRTLDELMGTKEEILASAEKSTESKLRAKDAEITRLRIWLEEAKKSNEQGREVLSSYQKRVTDKEMEMEALKNSNEESTYLLEQQIEKLQALLSEVIAEKDKDSENTKVAFDSVVEEKERQIAMFKESSLNELLTKEGENKQKEKDILRFQKELTEKKAELEQMQETVNNLQSVIKVNEEERSKLTEAMRTTSEARRQEMVELQERQQKLLEHKENELISYEMLTKEQTKHHEMALKDKDRRIEELSTKLAWVEGQLTHECLEKNSREDLNTKVTSLLKKMSDLKTEKEILEKDVVRLVTDVRARESKLNDIQKKCESESQKKQILQQDFDSLTRDLENWKSAMKLIEEERNSLEKEEKSLREDLKRKSNSLCEFECKVQSLESIGGNLEDVIRQLRAENTDSFQAQKNLEFAIREKDKEQNLLKEKLNISEKKFALEMEHKVMKEQANIATIANLRTKYEESQKENEELKTNLDERENDVSSLSRLLEDAKQQEHKLETELEQLSEEFEVLNEKHMRGKNEKEALERSLTQAVTLKQQELEELQQKLEKTVIDQKYEMEKREECWKEAMKVKNELAKDTRSFFEEKIMLRDYEIQKREKSLESYSQCRETFEETLKNKEATIVELSAVNKDILQKTVELEKAFEECKAKLNEAAQASHKQDLEITRLREKEERLKNTEKEIEDLQARLKEQDENCVAEIKNLVQSTEEGFKERENVAERMKAIIQGNAVKYNQSLQRKNDKISDLNKELENSNKDAEDMRANLAIFIQESDENGAKLNRDLKILENESAVLEKKVSELKHCLEKKDKELQIMEANLINDATDFERKQKLKDEETKNAMGELSNERAKVTELEESLSWLKEEVEQKEQRLQEITAKYETTEGELKETVNDLSSIQDSFNEVEDQLKLAERKNMCADEVKRNLIQELQKQKQLSNGKDGKITVLLHKIKMLKMNSFVNAQKHEKVEENVVTLRKMLNERETETNELKNEMEIKEKESYQRCVLLKEMELKRNELEKRITELEQIVSTQTSEITESVRREQELKRDVQDLLGSLKDNELKSRALVSNLEDEKSENEKLLSEYENFKTCSIERQGELHDEIDNSHSELDKQAGLLLMLNKEKERLLAELGKSKKAEENTKTTLECYINNLKKGNVSLTEKVTSLEKESKQRYAEIAELNSALSSAKVSKEFLIQEVERLKISVSGKDENLYEVRKLLEAAQSENSGLKYETKILEGNLARAVNEKDHAIESFEEVKCTTSQVKQKMEEVLSEKENVISSAEGIIRQLKQDNEALKSRLSKCEGELKADKKCVVDLLEKRREMSAEIESLNKDKVILEVSLRDMDLYPVKLKTTQESLNKTKDSLKAMKGQLKDNLEEKNALAKTVRDLRSMSAELKKKLDVQTTVKQAELELVKKQLDEKNKEFYDLKVGSTTQEMSLREAQMKIKELESSLKHETTFHQSVARRNEQMQQEIIILRERNKNEITFLKKSLNDVIGRWESSLQDKCSEQSRTHCIEKMDNKTIQKLRELYFKVSELETQLNQEKNEHLLSLALVQAEGQRYMTGQLRAE